MNLKFSVILLLSLFTLHGCANTLTTVKPYQRGILSKEEMKFDSDPNATAAREHFLNSLEGSSGGFGTGGGGCGCN